MTYLRAQRTITTRNHRGEPFRIGIRAVWNGGPYVNLWFGASNDPSEVINVGDSSSWKLANNPTQQQLARILKEWCDMNEQDERSYMDEDSLVRYEWLRLYFANSDAGQGIRRVFKSRDKR